MSRAEGQRSQSPYRGWYLFLTDFMTKSLEGLEFLLFLHSLKKHSPRCKQPICRCSLVMLLPSTRTSDLARTTVYLEGSLAYTLPQRRAVAHTVAIGEEGGGAPRPFQLIGGYRGGRRAGVRKGSQPEGFRQGQASHRTSSLR